MDILEFRNKMGLTQKALGEMLGYTARQVHRWENGVVKVPPFIENKLVMQLNKHV